MVAGPASGRGPQNTFITDRYHCYPITAIDGELRLVGWPTGGEPTRSAALMARIARELPGVDPATVDNGTDVGELRLGEADDPADGVVVAYDDTRDE